MDHIYDGKPTRGWKGISSTPLLHILSSSDSHQLPRTSTSFQGYRPGLGLSPGGNKTPRHSALCISPPLICSQVRPPRVLLLDTGYLVAAHPVDLECMKEKVPAGTFSIPLQSVEYD